MWIQCLITVLRQFFKSLCTTKQSEGKHICCALITDYYNPMNKHLSCQHLQHNLFLMIVILFAFRLSPFFMSSSHSHVFPIKREKSCSGRPAGHVVWGRHRLTTTSWLYKSGWGGFFICHPPYISFFPHLSRHPPPNTVQCRQKYQQFDLTSLACCDSHILETTASQEVHY